MKIGKWVADILNKCGLIEQPKQEKLQTDKKGGDGTVFGSELMIGSIRAQVNRLKHVLGQIEMDERWRNNSSYYAQELKEIEKALRIIRKADLEQINHGNINCYIDKSINN